MKIAAVFAQRTRDEYRGVIQETQARRGLAVVPAHQNTSLEDARLTYLPGLAGTFQQVPAFSCGAGLLAQRISVSVHTAPTRYVEQHSEMLRNAGNKVRAQRSANAELNNGPMKIAPSRTRIMFRYGLRILRILGWPFLMAVLIITPACAQQSFDEVAGSWSGVGSMKPSDGPRERVRCKVDYIVKSEGQSVKMNVRCASDAYKMELTANIDQRGSALSGNWFESQYRQGGKISGQNVNGLIEAKIEGDTITALLTVRTKGNRQSFAMESPGAWVSQVSIDLVRDPR